MNQIPRLGRFEVVGEGRHWSPIETGHEDAVQILIGLPTLEACSGRKIVRPDGVVLAVGEGGGRRAISVTGRSMTFPAFHFLEKRPAMKNALYRRGSLGRNHYGRSVA